MKSLIRAKIACLACLFFFSCTQPGLGSQGERIVDLRDTWKFTLGDNPKFADPSYKDSDWEEIEVPSPWQREGFEDYSGYAWYRIRTEVSYNDKDLLYLELGRIDDVDEVYVNGHLIGSMGGFPPHYFTAYNMTRAYLIPVEFLRHKGDNVIAVRVYDEGGEGGILGRNVGIYRHATYLESGFALFGNWKFRIADNKAWSEETYDDSAWEDVIAPATWESQGFREYDGFAWYRKKFKLPATFRAEDQVVLLGKIDDMDEVYINGQWVGQTGNLDRQWARDEDWQRPRTYFIPDGLLRPGKDNVIAVRVFDQGGNGGIFEGPLTIISRSEYKAFWKTYHGRFEWSGFWSLLDWD